MTFNKQNQTSSLIRFFHDDTELYAPGKMWFTLGLARIEIDAQAPFPAVWILFVLKQILFFHSFLLSLINK